MKLIQEELYNKLGDYTTRAVPAVGDTSEPSKICFVKWKDNNDFIIPWATPEEVRLISPCIQSLPPLSLHTTSTPTSLVCMLCLSLTRLYLLFHFTYPTSLVSSHPIISVHTPIMTGIRDRRRTRRYPSSRQLRIVYNS